MEPTHTDLRLILSWLSLLWERLWRALWPSVGVLGFTIVLALFDLPAWIPAWLHAVLLVVGVVALVAALRHTFGHLRVPTRQCALRRLQEINGLTHRPLESLTDELAEELGNTESRALWRLHRARMHAQTSSLRVSIPHPRLIAIDRLALRVGLGVLLVAGLTAAGSEAPERLQRALVPQLALFAPPKPPVIDAWLTPPSYTGIPPAFLAGPNAESKSFAEAPVGTIFSIRVSGGDGTPKIIRTRSQADAKILDGKTFSADLTLSESETIAVAIEDDVITEWTLRVTPDAVPVTAFLSTPSEGRGNVLRISFRASDDYGLTGVRAVITRDRKNKPPKAHTEREDLDLPLPRLGAKKAVSSGYHDMTPHPWAGLPVRVHLEATDAAGQVGRSSAIRIILPERQFTHPVAREIVVERRKLIAEPDDAALVADALRDIARQPERYRYDVTVFLALGTVVRRLTRVRGELDPDSLQQLLWDTALRVEDGKLSIARRNLREAEEALQKALEKDASDDDITRLMDELESALDTYLSELSKMMKQADQKAAQALPKNDRAMALTRQDLKKLMDEVRKLAQSGARADAKQLLSQLKNMLENMRTGQMARMSPRGQESMKLLNRLQNLIKEQQKLLDQTFRDAQRQGQMPSQKRRRGERGKLREQDRNERGRGRNMPGQGPSQRKMQPGEMSGGAQTQEALRRRLGEIMRQLGEMTDSIPRPMGRAERAMRQSSEFLGSDKPGEAIKPQTRALDQLQESAKSATRQLMRQMGQGLGQRLGEMGRQRDPFGRNPDGAGGLSTRDVGIDNADALQRAREIRDELRKRAGQRHRPELERNYIDRLLRQF
ncbi:MAG: TIGR02302 family protein [Alphaproteobacteria bacterium]